MPAPLEKTDTPGVYKRGPAWLAIWRDTDGKQRSLSLPTFEQAVAFKRAKDEEAVTRRVAAAETRPGSLDELGVKIAREHLLATAALGRAIEHMIRAGEALIEAKARVPDGQWMRWQRERGLSPDTMRTYKYLAEARPWLGPDLDGMTKTQAFRILREKGVPALLGRERQAEYADGMREQAIALRGGGATTHEIAEQMGVSQTTIARWTTPRAIRERRERERLRQQHAARAALQREETAKVARRRGDAVAESYLRVRQAQQELQRSLDRSNDRDERAALSEAYDHLTHAEDALGRAIRGRGAA